MRDIDLFQAALGLATPWFVSSSAFDAESKQLEISLDFPAGGRFACPSCGTAECIVHDVKQKRWRHLNFFQHTTILSARVPRITCGITVTVHLIF